MTTIVRQSTDVTVNVTQRTVTYVANTMFQMFLRITSARNLGPTYITKNRESIENGLFVWLAEHSLEQAYVEVFMPGEDTALERWDFAFTYTDSPDTGVRKPPVEELGNLCSKLQAIPEHAEYRIVVHTAPGSIKVPGWEPTSLRQISESDSQELQAWGYGNASVRLAYRKTDKNDR